MSIFEDMVWQKARSDYGHEFVFRTSGVKLGSVEGSARSYFPMAEFESKSDLVRSIFYGKPGFYGLSQVFDKITRYDGPVCMDGGGEGNNNASIYLILWGERTTYMVRPDGQSVEADRGLAAIIPTDWRFGVRISNIDMTKKSLDMLASLSEAMLLPPYLSVSDTKIAQAKEDGLPSPSMRPVFYMNKDVHDMFKSQLLLQFPDFPVDEYRTIPVRVLDELRSDEPRVINPNPQEMINERNPDE